MENCIHKNHKVYENLNVVLCLDKKGNVVDLDNKFDDFS